MVSQSDLNRRQLQESQMNFLGTTDQMISTAKSIKGKQREP